LAQENSESTAKLLSDFQVSSSILAIKPKKLKFLFSAIVDIGSASFKYDMRRLTEILAFPKAWYRRSIVRRLFLGDLSMSAVYSEGDDSPPSSFDDDTSPGLKPPGSFEAG